MVDKLSSQVEIFISCRRLPKLDLFSKSDPMVVMYILDEKTGRKMELGKTEWIKNEHDPNFKQTFTIVYKFEEEQQLLFEVYDIDATDVNNLNKHDFIGQANITLGTLVAAPGCTLTENLRKRNGQKTRGFLVLHCAELQHNKDFIEFLIGASGLPKMDGLFGKSDPYLEIWKPSPAGHMVLAHKTEVIMKNLNPTWAPFRVSVAKLGGDNNLDKELVFKVWDYDRNSMPDYIGEYKASISSLLESDAKKEAVSLYDPNKKGKKRGLLMFKQVIRTREVGFLDYIAGGMQVGLMVAIDFTGSNGDPRDPRSLHYRFGSTLNAYQQAITSIGSIVSQYDTDQRFPVWGFGGSIRGQTSHCFPLTFSNQHIEVQGVKGILDAYNNAFNHVLLSGPTYFTEVIDTAAAIASTPYQANLQHYSILLILTDGVINDMVKTVDAVVKASDLPLSIIIVGVGQADFSKMEELDSDDKKLRSSVSQKLALRDIVQFVPMRNFANLHSSALPKETLAELPDQVISYMKQKKVAPLPPRQPQLPDFDRMVTADDFATVTPGTNVTSGTSVTSGTAVSPMPSEQVLGAAGAALYFQGVGAAGQSVRYQTAIPLATPLQPASGQSSQPAPSAPSGKSLMCQPATPFQPGQAGQSGQPGQSQPGYPSAPYAEYGGQQSLTQR